MTETATEPRRHDAQLLALEAPPVDVRPLMEGLERVRAEIAAVADAHHQHPLRRDLLDSMDYTNSARNALNAVETIRQAQEAHALRRFGAARDAAAANRAAREPEPPAPDPARVVLLRGSHPHGTITAPDRGDGLAYVVLDNGVRCNFPVGELAPEASHISSDPATEVLTPDESMEAPF